MLKRYEHPKFWDNKSPSFGTLIKESQGKMTFGCSPRGEAQSILQGKEWCLFPKFVGCVKLVLKVVPTKFVASLSYNLH